MKTKLRTQCGVALIDALIAMVILAFGLLGVASLQTRVTREATDGQTRVLAARMGDELLSLALVDRASAPCYVLPTAAAGCTSTVAREAATTWLAEALAAMPPDSTATSELTDSNQRLTVTITWTDRAAGETRTVGMTTGVAL
jgi:type IV pilus assembly protein PilV